MAQDATYRVERRHNCHGPARCRRARRDAFLHGQRGWDLARPGRHFFEQFGIIGVQQGTLKPWELNILDKLADIINQETVPQPTTQVTHQVPEDTHTLVLNNPSQNLVLYENRDERAESPGAYFAFDDRADIVETAALNIFMTYLESKYGGDDFLV